MNEISSAVFLSALVDSGIVFFTGVPDSTLQPLLHELSHNSTVRHVIAANEGLAVAAAAGNYIATGNTPCVYMQNAGLGNAINPLTSLVNQEVYDIPLLLLIGWRGAQDESDEPQHMLMGRQLLNFLVCCELDYKVLTKAEGSNLGDIVNWATEPHKRRALVIRRGLFESVAGKTAANSEERLVTNAKTIQNNLLMRIVGESHTNTYFFSTTGYISRSLHSLSQTLGRDTTKNFYNVGAMGHVTAVAHEFALMAQKKVVVLDGDGSFLMHMGHLTHLVSHQSLDLTIVILDNECYESTGCQPSASREFSIASSVAAIETIDVVIDIGNLMITLRENFTPGIRIYCEKTYTGGSAAAPRGALQYDEHLRLFRKKLVEAS
jgi:phosphonopyruvate decarboxylase